MHTSNRKVKHPLLKSYKTEYSNDKVKYYPSCYKKSLLFLEQFNNVEYITLVYFPFLRQPIQTYSVLSSIYQLFDIDIWREIF